MSKNTIRQLNDIGQSIWLDNISRSLIESGKLKKFIELGISGLTSNPTIFDKAVRLSSDYDEKIKKLCVLDNSVFDIYDSLTVEDIQDAADLFIPTYETTEGLDGYVSLEVDPRLSMKVKETIEEAKRLHSKVNRPNLMLKIPATTAGFKATEELITKGININVTLIFSLKQYIDAAYAYVNGIKRLIDKGGNPQKVHSVASCFVSRIDTKIDKILDELIKKQENAQMKQKLNSLKGKAAVADSAIIYTKYLEIFSSSDFKQLQNKGANIQRALWGSTSTKNPAYSDIKYVTELVGKDTVNTMPENTFNAFLDHGEAKEALTADRFCAENIIANLDNIGIDINAVCKELLTDGVVAFEKSFESLLNAIDFKKNELCLKK